MPRIFQSFGLENTETAFGQPAILAYRWPFLLGCGEVNSPHPTNATHCLIKYIALSLFRVLGGADQLADRSLCFLRKIAVFFAKIRVAQINPLANNPGLLAISPFPSFP